MQGSSAVALGVLIDLGESSERGVRLGGRGRSRVVSIYSGVSTIVTGRRVPIRAPPAALEPEFTLHGILPHRVPKMRIVSKHRSCSHFMHHLLGTLAALAVCSAVTPERASGQFEGFLEKVTDVQFSTSCWSSTGEFDRTSCLKNYGIEVLWNLGRFPRPPKEPSTATRKLVRLEVTTGDTLFVYEPVPPSPPSPGPILLELGLGWGQITEIESAHPRLELHGSVRELPSVSLYATQTAIRGQPYIGIRSGIIKLQNAQMVASRGDTATAVKGYFGSAEAFQLGAVLGSAIQLQTNLHLTVEYGYHRRYFPSVAWAPSPADLPIDFPRSLDFSGHSLSLGLQVKLREPE